MTIDHIDQANKESKYLLFMYFLAIPGMLISAGVVNAFIVPGEIKAILVIIIWSILTVLFVLVIWRISTVQYEAIERILPKEEK